MGHMAMFDDPGAAFKPHGVKPMAEALCAWLLVPLGHSTYIGMGERLAGGKTIKTRAEMRLVLFEIMSHYCTEGPPSQSAPTSRPRAIIRTLMTRCMGLVLGKWNTPGLLTSGSPAGNAACRVLGVGMALYPDNFVEVVQALEKATLAGNRPNIGLESAKNITFGFISAMKQVNCAEPIKYLAQCLFISAQTGGPSLRNDMWAYVVEQFSIPPIWEHKWTRWMFYMLGQLVSSDAVVKGADSCCYDKLVHNTLGYSFGPGHLETVQAARHTILTVMAAGHACARGTCAIDVRGCVFTRLRNTYPAVSMYYHGPGNLDTTTSQYMQQLVKTAVAGAHPTHWDPTPSALCMNHPILGCAGDMACVPNTHSHSHTRLVAAFTIDAIYQHVGATPELFDHMIQARAGLNHIGATAFAVVAGHLPVSVASLPASIRFDGHPICHEVANALTKPAYTIYRGAQIYHLMTQDVAAHWTNANSRNVVNMLADRGGFWPTTLSMSLVLSSRRMPLKSDMLAIHLNLLQGYSPEDGHPCWSRHAMTLVHLLESDAQGRLDVPSFNVNAHLLLQSLPNEAIVTQMEMLAKHLKHIPSATLLQSGYPGTWGSLGRAATMQPDERKAAQLLCSFADLYKTFSVELYGLGVCPEWRTAPSKWQWQLGPSFLEAATTFLLCVCAREGTASKSVLPPEIAHIVLEMATCRTRHADYDDDE